MSTSKDRKQPFLSFKFQEIGPITKAELDLGDLTIIAGRNNTGKTYLVYTIYGLLKMSKQMLRTSLNPGSDSMNSSIEDQIVRDLMRSGQARYPVDSETFNQNRQAVLEDLTRAFSREGLANVFSYGRQAFEDASLEIVAPDREPGPIGPIQVPLSDNEFFSISYDGSHIVATADGATRHIVNVQSFVELFLIDFFLEGIPSSPFILSAERFGISLFYRELDFTKNQLVDMLQRMGDDKERSRLSPYLLIDSSTSRYALPIKDNIDYTRNIPDLKNERSEISESKLFDVVKDMMDGYYTSSESDIRFVSKARKSRIFNIPLHLASSSARGLSDLYFFLKHVAKRNQLLMIDEPESHLDTANQIQMARLLARFVRAGIKVLVTTHSDYIIKEFNNLIMLNEPIDDREAVVRELRYDIDDRLPQHSVRAYVAEGNTVRECTVDAFGIDMPIFDQSIDSINHVTNDLASRIDNVPLS